MKRATGRNIYIVSLKKAVGNRGADAFAARCKNSRLSAVWVRVGRGPNLDANFSLAALPAIKSALHDAGVEMWGWHVPFCRNEGAARDEADKVVKWASDHDLAGVLLDTERTPESPRFSRRPRRGGNLCEAGARRINLCRARDRAFESRSTGAASGFAVCRFSRPRRRQLPAGILSNDRCGDAAQQIHSRPHATGSDARFQGSI
jgi:hypothetical protein